MSEELKFTKVKAKIGAAFTPGTSLENVVGFFATLMVKGEVDSGSIMSAFMSKLQTLVSERSPKTIFIQVNNPYSGAYILNLNRVDYFFVDDWEKLGEGEDE